MDYQEFMEKSGWDVSREDYEQIVEPFYLKGPADVIGTGPVSFCKWLNDNGFNSVKQLKAIMSIVDKYEEQINRTIEAQAQICELESDLMLSRSNEDNIERRLRAVIRCFGEDTIAERMTDDISTDDIIDMYARMKGIE